MSKLVQTRSNAFKHVQTCSNVFKRVWTCSNVFKHIWMCSNMFYRVLLTRPNKRSRWLNWVKQGQLVLSGLNWVIIHRLSSLIKLLLLNSLNLRDTLFHSGKIFPLNYCLGSKFVYIDQAFVAWITLFQEPIIPIIQHISFEISSIFRVCLFRPSFCCLIHLILWTYYSCQPRYFFWKKFLV